MTIKDKSTIYLDEIYNTHNICKKYKKVLDVTNDHNNITLKDSFYENKLSIDDINIIFSNNKCNTYNIVIFGAGPCGLYIANLLKLHYKDNIEIVIIENRISEPHTKKIYSRKWLTNVSSSIFKGDGQINVFETLLYLSCRKMDV